jgi:hypothetical protein
MTIHTSNAAQGRSPAARLGVVSLDEIDHTPPRPLLLDRLDPEGHTVLFGDGGIGKSTLATAWAVELVQRGRRVLVLDYEGREREWAFRARMLGGEPQEILHAAPFVRGDVAPALWDHADAVRDVVDAEDVTVVVIDSISAACHGITPSSDEAATKYHAALQVIGRPVLSIAHVTKPRDGSDRLAKPYGSTQWHNLARVTWSLSEKDGKVALTHRKANAYERQSPREVLFRRDDTGWEVDDRKPLAPTILEQALMALADQPMTLNELSSRLTGVRKDSLQRKLRNARQEGKIEDRNGLLHAVET